MKELNIKQKRGLGFIISLIVLFSVVIAVSNSDKENEEIEEDEDTIPPIDYIDTIEDERIRIYQAPLAFYNTENGIGIDTAKDVEVARILSSITYGEDILEYSFTLKVLESGSINAEIFKTHVNALGSILVILAVSKSGGDILVKLNDLEIARYPQLDQITLELSLKCDFISDSAEIKIGATEGQLQHISSTGFFRTADRGNVWFTINRMIPAPKFELQKLNIIGEQFTP